MHIISRRVGHGMCAYAAMAMIAVGLCATPFPSLGQVPQQKQNPPPKDIQLEIARTESDVLQTVPEGKFEIIAFIRGRHQAHAAEEPSASRPVRGRKLIADPRTNGGEFVVNLADYGLSNYCCADNFKQLEIRYREINPFNSARLVARLTYGKSVAIDTAKLAPDVTATITAMSGAVDQTPLNSEVLDVADRKWINRTLLYPVKRILGLPESKDVFLTQIESRTVVQMRPSLSLAHTRTVQFVFGSCAPLQGLNVRFASRNGSLLLGDVATQATTSLIGDNTVVSLDLGVVRSQLRLHNDDASLQLSETIAFFPISRDLVASCRPFKAIRYAAPNSDVGEPLVVLPFKYFDVGNGEVVMRIRQTMFFDVSDWGHQLRDLALRIKPSHANGASGIELLDVRFVNSTPDDAPRGEASCVSDLLPNFSISMCPTKMQRMMFATLSQQLKNGTRSEYSLNVDASPSVGYEFFADIDGIRADINLPGRDDRLSFDIAQLAMSNMPRLITIEVLFSDGVVLTSSAEPGRFLVSGANTILVPPGQVPKFTFQRKTGSLDNVDRHFRLVSLEEATETPTQYIKRRFTWTSRYLAINTTTESTSDRDGGAGARPTETQTLVPYGDNENCHRFTAASVCGSSSFAYLRTIGSGLLMIGDRLSWIRIIPDAKPELGDHSALTVFASVQQSDDWAPVSQIAAAFLTWRDTAGQARERPITLNVPELFTGEMKDATDLAVMLVPKVPELDLILKEIRWIDLSGAAGQDPLQEPVLLDEVRPLTPRDIRVSDPNVEASADNAEVLLRASHIVPAGTTPLASWSALLDLRRGDVYSLHVRIYQSPLMAAAAEVAITVLSNGRTATVHLRSSPGTAQFVLKTSDFIPAVWGLDDRLDDVEVTVSVQSSVAGPPEMPFGEVGLAVDVRGVARAADLVTAKPLLRIDDTNITLPPLSDSQLKTAFEDGVWVNLGPWVAPGGAIRVRGLDHPALSVHAVRFQPAP